MIVFPWYTAFHMAVAVNPTRPNLWHHCKEYAGRALGKKNPKNYVTTIVWSGYKDGSSGDIWPSINKKAKELEEFLNAKSKEFGSSSKFKVSKVEEERGCLRIKVPPQWCHNRITAHLYWTYVRSFLINSLNDFKHLEICKDLLDHAREVGLDKFNEEMLALSKLYYHKLRGIVMAQEKWLINK